MKIDGKCHCGGIRYEAEVGPANVAICHCTDCQTQSGTAFRTAARSVAGTFKLLSGAPKIYAKTAESGAERWLAFCPNCGTALYGTGPGDEPKVYSLRVGAIRQREQLIPKAQIWCRSEQPWIGSLASIPRNETRLTSF